MFHFIVNPVSRSGKGLRLWQKKIEPVLKDKNIEYTVDFSHEHGDTTPLVEKWSKKAFLEKNCVIVLLGGDGTLNDAVQGITDFKNVTIGYIPTGSSNDFARDVKISRNITKTLLKILGNPEPAHFDVGEVKTSIRSRRFVVSCGIGFDAAVCQRAIHSRVKKTLNKVGLGKLTYLAIALKQIINAPQVDAAVSFDGKDPVEMKKFLFLASMIHRYEGGGFMFCPDALPDDGVMDYCGCSGLSSFKVIMALPSALFGKHKGKKGVSIGTYKKLSVKTTLPLWLHTDGEVWQKTDDFTIRTLDEKLKIII